MDDLSRAMSTSALNVKHLDIDFPFKDKYNNFINGKYVAPKSGQYFENPTPISGEVLCEIARSNEEDVNLALDAAHAAFPKWGKTSLTERANMLNKIADIMESNVNLLAAAETLDNG